MIKVLIFFFLFVIQISRGGNPPEPVVIEGNTMGTTYRVIYFDEPERRDYKASVDSLLTVVNKAINTYDPTSEISRFNKSTSDVRLRLPYLYEILRFAKRIHELSGGAFDPTVMPLVNAWGFGPEKSAPPTQQELDSLKKLVGFEKIRFTRKKVRKLNPHVQLDMGGIGQGFGADVIFGFLKSKGIKHMLVELGGEGIASGMNLKKNADWTIGILDPNSTPSDQFFKAYIPLEDEAFTTSGNYFNYKVIDGRKFGHTIDPSSGYPIQHTLLSASVFTGNCTTADAWATAFMVMGVDNAIKKIASLKDVNAILLYSDENGKVAAYITPGIEQKVILE